MENQFPTNQSLHGVALSQGHQHSIEVHEPLERRRQEIPLLLRRSAGDRSCSIFTAPQNLSKIKSNAFEPHIVSIGPYHHGKNNLRMIEEHKGRYLDNLLSRNKGISSADLFNAIKRREDEARNSYSGYIDHGSEKFVEMLVLDGCFIIEIIRIFLGQVTVNHDDPLAMMQWALPILTRDFIKLENQLPFFVLQDLFDLSKGVDGGEEEEVEGRTFTHLALRFFNYFLSRPDEVIERCGDTNLKPFHLLYLLGLTITPETKVFAGYISEDRSGHKLIPAARKLYNNGIGFEVLESDSLFHIGFNKGIIQIPPITLDDFMTTVFLNYIAFEQLHHTMVKHVNTYAAVFACLINRPEDVELLRDRKVIENRYGTDEEVANFFNALGKEVAIDIDGTYVCWE